MKKYLIILIFACLSCESEPIEPVTPENNVVFYTTGTGYEITINGYSAFSVHKNSAVPYPNCESQTYSNCGFKKMYMKAGTYSATLRRELFEQTFPLVVHGESCNTYDASNAYGWDN